MPQLPNLSIKPHAPEQSAAEAMRDLVTQLNRQFALVREVVNTNDRTKEWEYFEPAPVNGTITIRIPHYAKEIKAIKFGCVSGTIDFIVRVGNPTVGWTNSNWVTAAGTTLSAAATVASDTCVDGTGKVYPDWAVTLVFSNNSSCAYFCATIVTG